MHSIKIRNLKFKISLRSIDAFTLVELLITVAITVILTSVGFVMLNKYKGSQSIRLTLDQISSAILDTRNKAISQLNGSPWGIRFTNSSAVQRYEVFEGLNYASGTSTAVYSLDKEVKFSNPFSSSTIDLAFSSVTGALSNSQVISIVDGSADNLVGDFILNTLGGITQRFETGLVGYWHFDENASSTAYDATGNVNNGTLKNSPTWQTGTNCKAGSCLSFNGTNNYIQLGTSQSYASALTVSAWVFHTSASDWDDIVSGGCGNILFGFSNNVLNFGGQCNNPFTPISYSTNINSAWHYVAGTYDGSAANLYVDGSLVASSTKSGVFSVFTPTIGGEGITENFTGRIDEVRIYNRALSASEILGQYNDLK